MSDRTPTTVTGLVPRAVRIELDPGQVELLINELVTEIEATAGSLREDYERHGRLSHTAISEASEWLFEYRTLLDALNGEPSLRPSSATTVITASTVAADKLVRSCAGRAAHALAERVQARSADIGCLRAAGAAAAAWTETLADLRDLDDGGPDTILE